MRLQIPVGVGAENCHWFPGIEQAKKAIASSKKVGAGDKAKRAFWLKEILCAQTG